MMPHHYDPPDPDRQPRPRTRKPGAPRSGVFSDLWLALTLISGLLFAANLTSWTLFWLAVSAGMFVNEITGFATNWTRAARSWIATWGTAR